MNALVGVATGVVMQLTGVGDPLLWGTLAFAWAAMGMTVLIPWLIGQAVNAVEDGDKPNLLPLLLPLMITTWNTRSRTS